jgi:hypothetical protein
VAKPPIDASFRRLQAIERDKDGSGNVFPLRVFGGGADVEETHRFAAKAALLEFGGLDSVHERIKLVISYIAI